MQTTNVYNSDKKLVATFETKAEAEAYVAKNQHLVLESSDQQVVRGMLDGAFKFIVIGFAIVAYFGIGAMIPQTDTTPYYGNSLDKAIGERDKRCKDAKLVGDLKRISENCVH